MKRNGLSADVKMKANTTPLMYASFYDDEVTAKRLIDTLMREITTNYRPWHRKQLHKDR